MIPRERVLSAIQGGRPVDRPPVTSVTQVGIVEVMESISSAWPEAHVNPEKMVELGISLYKLAELETARIPFCLTVQAEALGCEVDLGKIDKTPSIVKHPYTRADEMTVPEDFTSKGRVLIVCEATKILREKYGDTLPIIVGIEGPFTLSGHLVGIEQLVRLTITNPSEVEAILAKAVEANVYYAEALVESGADVVCVCDPTASPDLLSPTDFKNLVKPRLTELAESIKALKVLHICGDISPIITEMAEAGYDALSVEDKVDVREAKRVLSERRPRTIRAAGRVVTVGAAVTNRIIGNVSTAKTIFMGSPSEVKEEAKRTLRAGVDLLAPACGLAPRSPLANVKALVKALKEIYPD